MALRVCDCLGLWFSIANNKAFRPPKKIQEGERFVSALAQGQWHCPSGVLGGSRHLGCPGHLPARGNKRFYALRSLLPTKPLGLNL